jgi:transposase InsO family protein
MFIHENRETFNILAMCKILEVSRAGFYAWRNRPESTRKKEDKRLVALIQTSFEGSRSTYGYRRICKDLHAQKELCGKHRIVRLMKENKIQPKTRRKFKMTTDSNHNKPIHNNFLRRQFHADAPDQRWVTDITYIPTAEGWLYLAVIMDLFSRKIVGWSMSNRMQEALVIDALKMALFRRKIKSSLLLHSDRGSQYASDNFQKILRENNIICSMSRKGDCWDNAAMESFFHSLKTECIHHERFQTRNEAKKTIFDYIEVFYNQVRRHSFLNHLSPSEYEKLMSKI